MSVAEGANARAGGGSAVGTGTGNDGSDCVGTGAGAMGRRKGSFLFFKKTGDGQRRLQSPHDIFSHIIRMLYFKKYKSNLTRL